MVEANNDDLTMTRFCMCASVRKAGRALTNLYDDMLAPSGLHATQFSLLAHLARASEETLTRLAEARGMDRTTLTRNLAPLERDGFVAVRAGADRRTRVVAITDAGRVAMERALPLWRAAQAHVAAELGGERFAALLKEMEAVTALGR